MVFGRRNMRGFKPAQLTTNHCIVTPFTTTANVENQQAVFLTVEPPTNRGQHIPASAILKGVDIQIWGDDNANNATVGLHRCMMLYRPASTAFGTPIASWLSTADPLTEEAIQVRQHILQKLHEYVIVDNAIRPAFWHCRWRGNRSLRDGDAIVLAIEDDIATNWRGLCTAWWIA